MSDPPASNAAASAEAKRLLGEGNQLFESGRITDAIERFRAVIRLRPDVSPAWNNLGLALKETGEIGASIEAFKAAIGVAPSNQAAWSNLLHALHFDPTIPQAEILAWHRRWGDSAPAADVRPHANDRSPDRRLRIGYVSPDFRDHPVGRFIAPVLGAHHHENFEVIGYSNSATADDVTRRLRGFADGWHDVTRLSDEQLAEQIRADRIDLLIDLAVHTNGNRLLAFARKPAPVQMTYVGTPCTSGLAAMDYRLTDPYLDPPGESDALYVEQSLRLPDSYWCYEPPIAESARRAPGLNSSSTLTFGCLNTFAKVSAPAIDAWAEVLAHVPGSRLIVRAHEDRHLDRVRAALALRGVDPNRLEHGQRTPSLRDHFAVYDRIDIALDPYPYGGGTTSCDALWMGVPLVTLAGQHAVGRVGVSLLAILGLNDLIATTPAEYVRIAAGLAGDRERLRSLQTGLRERMRASPLTDAGRLTRNLENLYRQAWRRWCGKVA